MPTHSEASDAAGLFDDVMPIGFLSTLDMVVPVVSDILSKECLPELNKTNPVLYKSFQIWQQKFHEKDEMPVPEDQQGSIPSVFQLLRECIEHTLKKQLKNTDGEIDD